MPKPWSDDITPDSSFIEDVSNLIGGVTSVTITGCSYDPTKIYTFYTKYKTEIRVGGTVTGIVLSPIIYTRFRKLAHSLGTEWLASVHLIKDHTRLAYGFGRKSAFKLYDKANPIWTDFKQSVTDSNVFTAEKLTLVSAGVGGALIIMKLTWEDPILERRLLDLLEARTAKPCETLSPFPPQYRSLDTPDQTGVEFQFDLNTIENLTLNSVAQLYETDLETGEIIRKETPIALRIGPEDKPGVCMQ